MLLDSVLLLPIRDAKERAQAIRNQLADGEFDELYFQPNLRFLPLWACHAHNAPA
jgi:hypothetical protein